MSLTRAAGMPPIITVAEPLLMIPGPAGTQLGNMHGVDWSLTRAAGLFEIITVGVPLMIVNGKAG